MKPTHTHPGWPFALLTEAGFSALARGDIPVLPEYEQGVVWDWDERTSRGSRRRPVMHLLGLPLAPHDFDPSPNIDADFDEEGNAEGTYYADGWDTKPAATLLEGVGQLDADQRVLIALWDRHGGHVAVADGGEDYVSIESAHDNSLRWSPADRSAQPHWIADHDSHCGVSMVLLDAQPPPGPGEDADGAGLQGLLNALDDLLVECPFPVALRDYAEDTAHPPGEELAAVRGLSARLQRTSETHGRVGSEERHGFLAGPFDW